MQSTGVLLPFALVVVAILAAFTLVPGLIAPDNPIALAMSDRLKPPSLVHLFGTDEGGRDVFSRVVFGAHYSLGVAIVIVFVSALFGVLYGALSGMSGGGLDNLMMRIVDLSFGFPALVLALAIAASMGRGLSSVALSLSLIWWPGYARTRARRSLEAAGAPARRGG